MGPAAAPSPAAQATPALALPHHTRPSARTVSKGGQSLLWHHHGRRLRPSPGSWAAQATASARSSRQADRMLTRSASRLPSSWQQGGPRPRLTAAAAAARLAVRTFRDPAVSRPLISLWSLARLFQGVLPDDGRALACTMLAHPRSFVWAGCLLPSLAAGLRSPRRCYSPAMQRWPCLQAAGCRQRRRHPKTRLGHHQTLQLAVGSRHN